MSTDTRGVPQQVTVCDLCNEIIPERTHSMDSASLSHGYIAHPVTEVTKRVSFHWPDRNRPGYSRTREQEEKAREMHVEWDFHAECVYNALKVTIEANRVDRTDGSEDR